ncbi:MAG: nitrite reductase (NAD(P)H) small subunit [Dehalococcoidia bacterium]|nr:nitrite reductase (NAD(P)H) small subunit [Dehalococcoidia bacterium]
MAKHIVAPVSAIPPGSRKLVQVAGRAVVVFNVGGEFFALADRCPHKGGPLSQGIVHGRAVACPLHNWSIDLASGEAMVADRGKGCAPVVPLQVRDGRLLLSLTMAAADG